VYLQWCCRVSWSKGDPTQGLCVRHPHSLQLQLLKGDMYWLFPRKNAPVYQCFTLVTLQNLVCHVWWALQCISLIETNYLYVPTPNGQSPSASLNKSNFLHMGQGFPHQLPVLENVILHPHVRRVACDDVTNYCALLLYKIAFILLVLILLQ